MPFTFRSSAGESVGPAPRLAPRLRRWLVRAERVCASRAARPAVERGLHGLGAGGADVGEAHAVGGEERGHRVDEAAGHAEGVGDGAGGLRPGAAEDGEA